MQARYDLAVDAIKTFHTGVSEDFLLKQDQFKELRDRLLKSAADFYGKLGDLLGNETDVASRRALAQANFELADLTDKVGRPEDALAAHRAVLARREALAADPAADPEAKADVGRSLTAVAASWHRPARPTRPRRPTARPRRCWRTCAVVAVVRARGRAGGLPDALGDLLSTTGKYTDALAVYRLARADQEAAAAAPGATNEARRRPGGHDPPYRHPAVGYGQAVGGGGRRTARRWRSEQKLADDNPAVTEFRTAWRRATTTSASCWQDTGKLGGGGRVPPRRWRLQQRLVDDNPAVTEFRSAWRPVHNNLGNPAYVQGQAAGGGSRVPQGAALSSRSWPTTTPPSPNSASRLADSHINLGVLLRARASRRRRRPSTRQAMATPAESWPTTTPPSPISAAGWQTAHGNLGILLSETGRPSEAEAEHRKAIALYQRLADDNPAVPGYRAGPGGLPHNDRGPAPHGRKAGRGAGGVRIALGCCSNPWSETIPRPRITAAGSRGLTW